MTELEILQATRNLIKKKENWTKGANARDKNGRVVSVKSDEAISFCLAGATSRVTDGNESSLCSMRVI
jgi:hypothetical protein